MPDRRSQRPRRWYALPYYGSVEKWIVFTNIGIWLALFLW